MCFFFRYNKLQFVILQEKQKRVETKLLAGSLFFSQNSAGIMMRDALA